MRSEDGTKDRHKNRRPAAARPSTGTASKLVAAPSSDHSRQVFAVSPRRGGGGKRRTGPCPEGDSMHANSQDRKTPGGSDFPTIKGPINLGRRSGWQQQPPT